MTCRPTSNKLSLPRDGDRSKYKNGGRRIESNNMTKSQRKQQAKKLDVIQRRHLDHHHYYPSMEIDLYSTRTSFFLARLDFFHLHQIKIWWQRGSIKNHFLSFPRSIYILFLRPRKEMTAKAVSKQHVLGLGEIFGPTARTVFALVDK